MPAKKTKNSRVLAAHLAREMIRSVDLRATPARIALLQLLTTAAGPLSHAEIVEQLGSDSGDASTLFRALQDLTEAGLLRRMELGDHSWRYERVVSLDPAQAAHPHFLCLACGAIQCLDLDEWWESGRQSRAWQKIGEVTEILLKGHCSACR